jgi:hypothetical protein
LRGARDAGVLPTTVPWLDIRGNHDAFNVPWLGHRNDFFHTSRESKQALNESHYVHDVVAPCVSVRRELLCCHVACYLCVGGLWIVRMCSFGSYRFVAIDSVMQHAPSRHVFGTSTHASTTELEAKLKGDRNMTIVFGVCHRCCCYSYLCIVATPVRKLCCFTTQIIALFASPLYAKYTSRLIVDDCPTHFAKDCLCYWQCCDRFKTLLT